VPPFRLTVVIVVAVVGVGVKVLDRGAGAERSRVVPRLWADRAMLCGVRLWRRDGGRLVLVLVVLVLVLVLRLRRLSATAAGPGHTACLVVHSLVVFPRGTQGRHQPDDGNLVLRRGLQMHPMSPRLPAIFTAAIGEPTLTRNSS
jgi:hypothetical protein